MIWRVATTGTSGLVHCGSCRAPIGSGEVYALVTAAKLVRCAPCVKTTFDQDPPPDVWGPEVTTDALPAVVQDSTYYRPPAVRQALQAVWETEPTP